MAVGEWSELRNKFSLEKKMLQIFLYIKERKSCLPLAQYEMEKKEKKYCLFNRFSFPAFFYLYISEAFLRSGNSTGATPQFSQSVLST